MSRPRGRFARSKARHGDSLRHQIPAPCPHSPPPPTGFTLIGALICIESIETYMLNKCMGLYRELTTASSHVFLSPPPPQKKKLLTVHQ